MYVDIIIIIMTLLFIYYEDTTTVYVCRYEQYFISIKNNQNLSKKSLMTEEAFLSHFGGVINIFFFNVHSTAEAADFRFLNLHFHLARN